MKTWVAVVVTLLVVTFAMAVMGLGFLLLTQVRM